jgi:hypothetical protein
MGTAFAAGHAAGVVASAFSLNGVADPAKIRNTLLSQNALIDRDAMPAPIEIR